MITPTATIHPMIKIIFAPFTIDFLPLRFIICAKEPAETGIPRTMKIIFQPQTPQLGPKQKVSPIATSKIPKNKEIAAPDKKPPWNFSFGWDSSLPSTITFR